MERPIEGPEPFKAKLSSEEAGTFLKVKGDLFEKLMATHLPTVRPIYMGRYKMWAWMDVAVLNHVLDRANTIPPEKKGSEGKSDDDE